VGEGAKRRSHAFRFPKSSVDEHQLPSQDDDRSRLSLPCKSRGRGASRLRPPYDSVVVFGPGYRPMN